MCPCLTLPGLRRFRLTRPAEQDTQATHSSAMCWHSSGTLRVPGCTTPQLNTHREDQKIRDITIAHRSIKSTNQHHMYVQHHTVPFTFAVIQSFDCKEK